VIDEVALNLIGHDSYFASFPFPLSTVFAPVVVFGTSFGDLSNDASTRHSPNCILLRTIDLGEGSHARWRVMRNVRGKPIQDIRCKLSTYSNLNFAA
jgi:hypothetical protein